MKPYRVMLSRFLKANEDHPSLNMIYTSFAAWVTEGEEKAPTWPTDTMGKLRAELRRLHRGGVVGVEGAQEIFNVVASLYLLSHYEPNTLPIGPELTYAMARAVLSLRTRDGYVSMSKAPGRGLRKITTGTSKGVLDAMGRYLIHTTLPVLMPMVEAIEQQQKARKQRQEELQAAVEAQPFK